VPDADLIGNIRHEDCNAVLMEYCCCDSKAEIPFWIEQFDWIDWYEVCAEVVFRLHKRREMTWSEFLSVRKALCQYVPHIS